MASRSSAQFGRRWIVSQIGSRELYACPLSFHRQGKLRLFYTDAWCRHGRRLAAKLPSPLWGFSRRFHPELPGEMVVDFTASMAGHFALDILRRRHPTSAEKYQEYLDIGKWFARHVAGHLAGQSLDPAADAVLAFNTGALETLEFTRAKGLFGVVDQLDPGKTDEEMVRQESEAWPGWEALPGAVPGAYYERLGQEWELSDMVVVNSEFSRRAIMGQGVAAEKLAVVPLAYEPETTDAAARASRPGKRLEVLWLGQVILRKGIPYFLEAARKLVGENVHFHVAGRIGINEVALREVPGNVSILGKITREKALELYRTSDLFVLPTISDGFAITQLEAMSHGLPVITTPNCGDVVTPGVDGEIIPIRDAGALAESIMRAENDREKLAEMSRQALVKSGQFTLRRYCDTIEEAAVRLAPRAAVVWSGGEKRQPHQWIVAQIGSRQHYGVPRGFENIHGLKRFYTDAWCPRKVRGLLRRGPRSVRSFASRFHGEVPSYKVRSRNLQAVRDAASLTAARQTGMTELYTEYLRIGREFDQWVARDLVRRGRVEAGRDAYFGFNTGALETLGLLRERGVRTVLDQIDPGKVEEEMVLAEMERWPGWESMPGRIPQAYWEHMSREWGAADLVLVNSNWSKQALIRQGVPGEKICVLALPYEADVAPIRLPRRDDGPLTVLWLGSVILRKGIQYLIEAAKTLSGTRLRFVIAGPVGISDKAVATAPANMSFLGRITRDQTDRMYQEADVFVLPTVSDGFAVTQVEAMSKGLPVVTTPNCGEVVLDGVNGLIVPACDSAALAAALSRLDEDRKLLAEMSHNAFIRSTQFLLPTQARQVEAKIAELEGDEGLRD